MISQISTPAQQRLDTSIDIDLSETLDLHSRNLSLNLNCHHIGVIQTFDSSNQTASISINYPMTQYVLNQTTQTYDEQPVPYPILLMCPVIFLGGGNSHLTFPVNNGDECLVLFNDRDIDNWFQGGSGSQVNSSRLHSFADGIALVGIKSLGKVISNFDTTHAVISASTGKSGVNISNGKVLISNNGTSLNSILQSLITDIKAITVSGTPIDNAAAFTAIATQLGALLE